MIGKLNLLNIKHLFNLLNIYEFYCHDSFESEHTVHVCTSIFFSATIARKYVIIIKEKKKILTS